ncbi:MAG: hypothetical protein H0X59_03705 [Chloroflexi bacterium]|nr:hypothetical protein [Chloroflexota bacterium]
MRLVWEAGDAPVPMVSTRLNEGRERPLAYTTVMTVRSSDRLLGRQRRTQHERLAGGKRRFRRRDHRLPGRRAPTGRRSSDAGGDRRRRRVGCLARGRRTGSTRRRGFQSSAARDIGGRAITSDLRCDVNSRGTTRCATRPSGRSRPAGS